MSPNILPLTQTHTHTVSHHAPCLFRRQPRKAALPWQPGYMRNGALRRDDSEMRVGGGWKRTGMHGCVLAELRAVRVGAAKAGETGRSLTVVTKTQFSTSVCATQD